MVHLVSAAAFHQKDESSRRITLGFERPSPLPLRRLTSLSRPSAVRFSAGGDFSTPG